MAELLAVITILIILAALLIPVVGKVHQIAYQTATRNEIAQIVTACQNYQQDFRAYPGPVSNSDIETMSIGTTNSQAGVNLNGFGPILISNSNGGSGTTYCITGAMASNPTGPASGFLSGSDNLVLGLLGGLWRNPNITHSPIEYVNGTPIGVTYTNPNTLIGTGPRSLASGSSSGYSTSNKQYTSYLPVTFPGSTMMLNGDGTPEDGVNPYHYGGLVPWNTIGNGKFFNTVIPVFTDQFPDPLPILFMRARVGAPGIISGPAYYTAGSPPTPAAVTDPTFSGPPGPTARYNYDLYEIIPFTHPTLVGIPAPGLSLTTGVNPLMSPISLGGEMLEGIYPYSTSTGFSLYSPALGQAMPTSPPYNLPVPTNTPYNAGMYFMNMSIAPTNSTTGTPPADYLNATGTPREKDEFILISAGKDRIYGSADDITNFGDVEP
jgi:type II secretory pathway pseudopilin PulG